MHEPEKSVRKLSWREGIMPRFGWGVTFIWFAGCWQIGQWVADIIIFIVRGVS